MYNEDQPQENQKPQLYIKQLGFVLFMGTTLHERFTNKILAIRNRKMVEIFATPIS